MLDTATLAICNKINADLQIERFNERMVLIARCFEYDKFLGVPERELRLGNHLYYNNYFDQLMDMKLWDLEDWEVKMFKITKDYGDAINRYPTKE
jgi:hypothetical protein